jgi:hypothetical protein
MIFYPRNIFNIKNNINTKIFMQYPIPIISNKKENMKRKILLLDIPKIILVGAKGIVN